MKTKFVDSMNFGIHCNTFFQQKSSFPKFSVKQAVRKLSGVNFNYTYRLYLVPVIRISFDKNLIYPEIQAARIQKSSSYVPNLLDMFKTKYYIKYNNKYTIFCYLLSFLHNLKLKTELIID